MKILLDTHMLIWILTGDQRLPEKAVQLFENEQNVIFVSVVSLWEIALKNQKHPEHCPVNAEDCVLYVKESGIEFLDLKKEHILQLGLLRIKEGHYIGNANPFDQLLIAQAKSEEFFFLTHDSLMQHYDEPNLLIV